MVRARLGGNLLGMGGILALFLLGSRPGAGPSSATETKIRIPRFTPGEVIVMGRSSPIESPLAPTSQPEPLDLSSLREIATRGRLSIRRTREISVSPSTRRAFTGGAWVMEIEPGRDPREAAELLARDPRVAYAGPNHVVTLTAPSPSPKDPLFSGQWALESARVPEAWERTRGQGVLVAIIDTGIDAAHPDLEGQIAVNLAESNGSPGVDDDGNGYVDDVLGYDFTDAPGLPGAGDFQNRDPDPDDDWGHGTHVSGLAAAAWDDTAGIVGVAPGARILVARAGFQTSLPFAGGLLQEDDIGAAILYAVDRGAHILNLSFGHEIDTPLIREAIRYARDQGVLVVASAGNTPGDLRFFPSSYPGVLAVGASSSEGERVGFSTYGQDLDLLAPGASVLTTHLDGRHHRVSGTSFSAPIAMGAAALVWSLHPEWTAEQVAWTLRLSARREGPGWNPDTGWGLLDAAEAVRRDHPPPVAQVERVEASPERARILGTVAHPDLLSWSLSVLPEEASGGEWSEGATTLVNHQITQVVAGELGVFSAPPNSPEYWVVRLMAQFRGGITIEERTRFYLPRAELTLVGLEVELRAGDGWWNLGARWSSTERHQGALRVDTSGGARFSEETSVTTDHGVHLEGPVPTGTWPVRVLGRTTEGGVYRTLAERSITVPPVPPNLKLRSASPLPPGSPMSRSFDWDGDGLAEVLIETPGIPYGQIEYYEMSANGVPELLGTSSYKGYPVDVADADGDGLQEIVVFQVFDEWFVYEQVFPGQIPRSFVYKARASIGTPWRYVEEGGGVHLLVVSGNALVVYEAQDGAGYREVSRAVAEAGGLLQPRGDAGDFDGDGILELAVSDQDGNLVLFELSGGGLRWVGTITPPSPAISMLTVREDGRPDLLTLEQDELGEQSPGAYGTRVRRWRWSGDSLIPAAVLSWGGIVAGPDLGLLPAGEEVVLRRNQSFDLVRMVSGGIQWGGPIFLSSLVDVDGAVALDMGDPLTLWVGSIQPQVTEGQLARFDSLVEPRSGSELLVERAQPVAGGIHLVLGWDPDGCPETGIAGRSGTVRGTYPVPLMGRTIEDTVAVGEGVRYWVTRAPCGGQERVLTGKLPPPMTPRWEGRDQLVLEFEPPLSREPREVAIRTEGEWQAPTANHLDHERHRLVITVGAVPDSLAITGAWDLDGFPVGGSLQAQVAVPPPPDPEEQAVLTSVRYRATSEGARLEVELSGTPLPELCPAPLRLEPLGWNLTPFGGGSQLRVDLPRPLAAGRYTLHIREECLGGTPDPLGQARAFAVGVAVYPNPLPPGADLTVENLEPGSRLRVLDVAGRERLSLQIDTPAETLPLNLAPGLYILRVEDPGGTLVDLRKLAVIR